MNKDKKMIRLLSTVVIATILFTVTTTNSVFAQVPALENPPNENDKITEEKFTIKSEEPKEEKETIPNTSFGKITIPISSGEQIILEVPLKTNNTYQLLPIK